MRYTVFFSVIDVTWKVNKGFGTIDNFFTYNFLYRAEDISIYDRLKAIKLV